MKRNYYIFVFLFLSITAKAGLLSGQQYSVSSVSAKGHSMFINNASLNNDAEVLLWIETDVPAQRWIFTKNDDGTYTITNAYSQKVLYRKGNAVDGATITQSDNVTASASKWTLTPVPNQSERYYISQKHRDGSTELYLETPSIESGSVLELRTLKNGIDSQGQIWEIKSTNLPTILTDVVRDEMMEGWKTKYYKKASSGHVLGSGGWWGDAEMFEVVLDAYETTGNPEYETMFKELYKNFIARNRTNWLYNDFNDDIAWMVIASVRGYLMFGDVSYLTTGKTNFDQMYSRALLPSGMLRWKEGADTQNGTNSCINGPAEVAACYLAIALKDDSYNEKAKSLYDLQRKYLYVPFTGQVYDSFTWVDNRPSNYNYWSSTYNQGTYLGASVMLYNRYGDIKYKNDAEMIMRYTNDNLCDENGVVKVCQVGRGDLAGFKGILMRYVRRFIVDLQKTEYVDWMHKNALHAYNNRNSVGITSSAWLTKTPENFSLGDCGDCNFNFDPFGPSTAVSIAYNAPLDKNTIVKNAFNDIQAENFDYLKGIHVQSGTNGNLYEIGNIKDGFYVGYNNVHFGNNLASSIEIRVSKAQVKSSIEVRLGNPEGDLLATVSIPRDGADWHTITENIAPIAGMQNIYLVFTGVVGQSDMFKIDYFRFKADTFVYSDITDNKGLLTSSVETGSLNHAIDNFLNTSVVLPSNSDFWLQYASPFPVELQAYAIFSGNENADKDPKSWILQGSNDGENWFDLDKQNEQQFTSRYQKKTYTLSTRATYTFFRLNINKNNGNISETQFAEWQLYGSSISTDDITADIGELSTQYAVSEKESSPINLTDKSVTTTYLVDKQSDFWIEYKANGLYKLTTYSLTSAVDLPDADPKSWTMYGSKDGVHWSTIDQRYDQLFDYRTSTQYYNSEVDEGYQYFRLHITSNNGASISQIAEWQLFGDLYFDYLSNDITMNGGELSSSSNSTFEDLKHLTDNNGNTQYVLDIPETPAWIQYKSSTPISILAYSVVAGYDRDKDPRNWTFQGSNDGQNWDNIHNRNNISFSKKGEGKTYSVNTSKTYTYFRLNITRLSNTNSSEAIIGEWELHGTGIFSKDITSNQGTISAELEDRNTFEGVEKLIDKKENSKYCNFFYGSTWVQYKSIDPVKVNVYSITSANDEVSRDPRGWTLEASRDGSDWELIDSRSNQEFSYRGATQYFGCNKDLKEYTYFRLNITENNGANLMQFSEWQLLYIEGTGDTSNNPTQIENEGVGIYPNPVQDILYLDMPQKGISQITNLTGQIHYNNRLNAGLQTIQVSDFEPGIYIVSVRIGTKITTKKIIKK